MLFYDFIINIILMNKREKGLIIIIDFLYTKIILNGNSSIHLSFL